MGVLQKLDRWQKRHRSSAVAFATVKKFSEDNLSNLATMVAFWAFFSIFPLLLVLVTLLGWLLPASDKHDVLIHVANAFPLLSANSIGGLTGAWWPLVLGILTSLWSGLGVIGTLQFALNSTWEVPRSERPGMFSRIRRSLFLLCTVGAGFVATTLISSFLTGASTGVHLALAGRIGGYVLSVLLDVGLVVVTFRMLTVRDVGTRDVLPGAILTGVAFWVLQELSAFIISRHLKNAQSTYGHFATVITILWWFYLESLITMVGAQLNVVLKRRLYPRSLIGPAQTEADRRALGSYAAERAEAPGEKVTVEVPSRPAQGFNSPGRSGEPG